jgi:hypothetical protein
MRVPDVALVLGVFGVAVHSLATNTDPGSES